MLVVAGFLLVSCASELTHSLVTPLGTVLSDKNTGTNPTPDLPISKKQPQIRGVWMATVSRLDWPPLSSVNTSSPAQRINLQKQALREKFDNLQRLGINTLFFQVKPDGTALWQSKILPWSEILTGRIGQYPGYDPLRFVLDEAHKRGIKVHAWFNPYRVSVNTSQATVAAMNQTLSQHPASVFVLHREWIRVADNRFVLDPGLPQVRDWITSIVAEVATKYPIDGVQFDDYFYSESSDSVLNDSLTYRVYGQGFSSKADWRRHNTQLLIEQVSRTLHQLKPHVEFGISPVGVWRNRSHDTAGSDTRGAAAYDQSYADTRRWVKQGLIDYIAPQLYRPFSRSAARYDVLAKWWANVVTGSHTRLYIGVALYKVGAISTIEPEWAQQGGVPELKKQLDLNESLPQIQGTILFRENFLNQPQTRQAVEFLHNRWGD